MNDEFGAREWLREVARHLPETPVEPAWSTEFGWLPVLENVIPLPRRPLDDQRS
ncbi:hypothetical protein [Umezawaea beigongshangensis]|uniref:hypothetical protein n=1 Tax=Umezawaea beigongshangensis TaxID=2780383 RepID=UPI0018F1386F|nr:hypothetical protein [Umezawaea beigongshangensis]